MTPAQQKRLTERRERRGLRARRRIVGFPGRPRLAVHRSNKHFAAQIIDDTKGHTLAAASTVQDAVRGDLKHGGNVAGAVRVAQALAERAKAKGIAKVVLDRGPYLYHGRVKAFAEAARKAGLQF